MKLSKKTHLNISSTTLDVAVAVRAMQGTPGKVAFKTPN
jgi:hypothetical protein